MSQQRKGNEDKTQGERFIKAARDLGCDESEATFNAALGKVARHKGGTLPRDQAKPKTKPAK